MFISAILLTAENMQNGVFPIEWRSIAVSSCNWLDYREEIFERTLRTLFPMHSSPGGALWLLRCAITVAAFSGSVLKFSLAMFDTSNRRVLHWFSKEVARNSAVLISDLNSTFLDLNDNLLSSVKMFFRSCYKIVEVTAFQKFSRYLKKLCGSLRTLWLWWFKLTIYIWLIVN